MGKVIILKTGETCEDADIRVMQEIELNNTLNKVKRLLLDKGLTDEALAISDLIFALNNVDQGMVI